MTLSMHSLEAVGGGGVSSVSSVSWGREIGGTSWSIYLDVEKAFIAGEETAEGVGERLIIS